MAIKQGMTILEAIAQLTRGFVKTTGRQPEALEKILIKREAKQKLDDLNKVVDLKGKTIDTSKGILGGQQTGMFDNIFNRMQKEMGKDPVVVGKMKPKNKISAQDLKIKKEYEKAVKEGKFKGTEEDFRDKIDMMMDDIDNDFAQGGMARIGYKKGTIDLARRAFLKTMGVTGAGIGALKMGALKLFGKGATKEIAKDIIKTDVVAGKPEWFDALVTKVINEGTDVSKNFATKEREVVHKLDIDKFEDVTVYRDLDSGEIRVSYESPTNAGEQSVDLVYKKPLPDQGDPNPSAEFYAVEPEPRVVNMDGDMEFDGENMVSSVDELMSDTTKLKILAKGDNKPTLKEFVTSKRKKDSVKKLNENPVEQAEYLEQKYGPAPDEDPNAFASGGLAGMLGE